MTEKKLYPSQLKQMEELKAGKERFMGVWVSPEVIHKLNIVSAIKKSTNRALVEQALQEFFIAHEDEFKWQLIEEKENK